jgi:2'-5' RNA ligase
MAKERLKIPRARLFVALDLPDSVRAGVVAWGRESLSDPALRRVAPESLHITLAFLGCLPLREIERLTAIVREVRRAAPSVELSDPVSRPLRGRPRLFALPAESAATEVLQAELQERLMEAGLYKSEQRQFWPHLTVARVRPEEPGSRRAALVSRAPGALPQALLQPFDGVRVTLYRSQIQPRGAQYTPLAQVELSKDGRQ